MEPGGAGLKLRWEAAGCKVTRGDESKDWSDKTLNPLIYSPPEGVIRCSGGARLPKPTPKCCCIRVRFSTVSVIEREKRRYAPVRRWCPGHPHPREWKRCSSSPTSLVYITLTLRFRSFSEVSQWTADVCTTSILPTHFDKGVGVMWEGWEGAALSAL